MVYGSIKFLKLGILVGGWLVDGWLVGYGIWAVGRCSVDWDEVV